MMRVILGLTAIGLLWFTATDSDAQQQGGERLAELRVPGGWPHEVSGFGQTEPDAQRNAVDAARKRIQGFLASQEPPLDAWQPDAAYVKRNLLDGEGHAGPDVKLNVSVVKQWVQPLKAPNWSELVRLNQKAQRQQLSVERQTTAGYGLAILTVLLATGWGYLRVDEWTGGRMSKWLGIGAAAVVALLAVAWWCSL